LLYAGILATPRLPTTYISHCIEQHPFNLSNTYQLFFITNPPPLKKYEPIHGVPNCLIPLHCYTPLYFWPDFGNVKLRITLKPLARIYNLVECIAMSNMSLGCSASMILSSRLTTSLTFGRNIPLEQLENLRIGNEEGRECCADC